MACIPAYNEEKTIARVILQAQKHVNTVIVCDDGSSDLTGEIAHRLGAVVIHHKKNLGYGAALQSLFKKATDINADVIVTIDADAQHDPAAIPQVINPILKEKADIVLGTRFLAEDNNVPAYRRFGIKLLTHMSNGSLKDQISDAQCGFRAYSKNAMQKLTLSEKGMGISAEILKKANKQGLSVAEVSVRVNYKGTETSTYNPFRHGLMVISAIIRLVVEERPLFYLGLPSLILIATGLGFTAWTINLYTQEGRIIMSVALAAASFLLCGIFVLFTAITLYAILRLNQKQRST